MLYPWNTHPFEKIRQPTFIISGLPSNITSHCWSPEVVFKCTGISSSESWVLSSYCKEKKLTNSSGESAFYFGVYRHIKQNIPDNKNESENKVGELYSYSRPQWFITCSRTLVVQFSSTMYKNLNNLCCVGMIEEAQGWLNLFHWVT